MKPITYMKKLLLLTAATLGFLGAPTPTFAQSGWTTPCSAGATIDEASQAVYLTSAQYLTFAAGQVGTVQARYDVTNTAFPSASNPPWTIMELDCFDNNPAVSVTATLFEYDPCEHVLTQLCAITSADMGNQCIPCQFPPNTFDFVNNVYWVQLNIVRNNAALVVRANSLRIH